MNTSKRKKEAEFHSPSEPEREVLGDLLYAESCAQGVYGICEFIVCLCRLRRVVMDGWRSPADVLFFYKTLPLRTGAQGRACHVRDE